MLPHVTKSRAALNPMRRQFSLYAFPVHRSRPHDSKSPPPTLYDESTTISVVLVEPAVIGFTVSIQKTCNSNVSRIRMNTRTDENPVVGLQLTVFPGAMPSIAAERS